MNDKQWLAAMLLVSVGCILGGAGIGFSAGMAWSYDTHTEDGLKLTVRDLCHITSVVGGLDLLTAQPADFVEVPYDVLEAYAMTLDSVVANKTVVDPRPVR